MFLAMSPHVRTEWMVQIGADLLLKVDRNLLKSSGKLLSCQTSVCASCVGTSFPAGMNSLWGPLMFQLQRPFLALVF